MSEDVSDWSNYVTGLIRLIRICHWWPLIGYSRDFLLTVRSQLLSLMLVARLLNCSAVTLQSDILSSLMLRQLASTACTVTTLRGILDRDYKREKVKSAALGVV